jgi:hypothetical protein
MVPLIDTAQKLLSGTPTDADIRRAVSTIYYAIFHHLCDQHARLLVQDETLGAARYQAYRSVEHGIARAACTDCRNPGKGFPTGIIRYADAFSQLQDQRHDADYNPAATFNLRLANVLAGQCQKAIAAFDAEPERHRRAFVVFVALKRRSK